MEVDPCGVAGLACRHHAFDDHHVFVLGGLLIQADDFLEQLIQIAVAEAPFDMGEGQGLGRMQAVVRATSSLERSGPASP